MTSSVQHKQKNMTASPNPLFYQNPVALDKTAHRDFSVAPQIGFGFTAHVNAVPVTLIELPQIMQFYPIAFSSTAPASPLAILGLRDNENLFVNENGQWLDNTYVPAYIRRYPFIFGKDIEHSEQLTLCIDAQDAILQKGTHNPLFNANGELTDVTQNALNFCRSYQAAAEHTLEFSNALEQSGILIDRHAEIRLNEQKTITLSGFRQIDETAFKALGKDIIGEWHEKNWLSAVYAHIFSDNNWQRLFQLMDQRLQSEASQNV